MWLDFYLTRFPLDKMAAISIVSNAFSSLKSFVFWNPIKDYSSISLAKGLAPNKREYITWTHADPIQIYATTREMN